MIRICPQTLRQGCERAHDLFRLNRLRGHDEAAAGFDSVFQALGVDAGMRGELQETLAELVPVKGVPPIQALTEASMLAGVLVGLLIADSSTPAPELDLPTVGS